MLISFPLLCISSSRFSTSGVDLGSAVGERRGGVYRSKERPLRWVRGQVACDVSQLVLISHKHARVFELTTLVLLRFGWKLHSALGRDVLLSGRALALT